MIPEDTLKLIQMRRNPVNSLQDLKQKLIGTREGFIFYTSSFRNDLETKMYMLGHLEQENQQLKSTLEEIRECIKEHKDCLEKVKEMYIDCENELLKTSCIQLINNELVRNDDLLQIIDKGVK